jgi:hypothetical protein
MKLALARPPIIDAVLVFGDDAGSSSSNHDDGVAGGGGGAQSFSSGRWLLKEGTVDRLLSNTSSSGAGDSKRDTYTQAAVASHGLGYSAAANLSLQLTQLKIRMNHTDVPPTQFLLDAFDVQPSRINGLSLYRRWVVVPLMENHFGDPGLVRNLTSKVPDAGTSSRHLGPASCSRRLSHIHHIPMCSWLLLSFPLAPAAWTMAC